MSFTDHPKKAGCISESKISHKMTADGRDEVITWHIPGDLPHWRPMAVQWINYCR